tara:strand:- start:6587 stop:7726 length:1140 start_codon:yes stop_codon:yes gene_type:complete
MLNFLKKAFSPPADGLDVWVGKPPRSIKVHVTESALNACPALRKHLYHGAIIVNTDVIVFKIALEYLERNGVFGKILTRNPIEKLIGSSDMMLKLAKAWHLAGILECPEMQNNLIDTFSGSYQRFLELGLRMPLSREPFEYLRDHIGFYTKCEKYLIDFYAGLARHGGPFAPARLNELPGDIAQELQHRRAELMANGYFADRIAQGSMRFKVSKTDHTQRTKLQVRSSSMSSLASMVPSTRSRPSLVQSRGSIATVLANPSPQSPIRGTGHRHRLSLPLLSDLGRNPERVVSRGLQPALRPALMPKSRRPAQTRSSSMPILSLQAPFMSPIPTYRSQSELEAEEDSTDEEDAKDELALTVLRERNDSHQEENCGAVTRF